MHPIGTNPITKHMAMHRVYQEARMKKNAALKLVLHIKYTKAANRKKPETYLYSCFFTHLLMTWPLPPNMASIEDLGILSVTV